VSWSGRAPAEGGWEWAPARGLRLVDEKPRPGAHGLVAFIHPSSTGGVLMELVQHGG
jgi:methylmalonyl-CoA/ethylmalonyl-CoA epimerase